MSWTDPTTWFYSKPSTPAASTGAAPAPLATPATTAPGPYGGRRRKTRRGRKSSRRSRSGRKSTRS